MTTTVTITTVDGNKHSLDLADQAAQDFAQQVKNTFTNYTDSQIKGAVYSHLGSVPSWVVKTSAITAVDLVTKPDTVTSNTSGTSA